MYFTFHNVSINTDIDWGNKEVIIYFTFHNVSINTQEATDCGPFHTSLHSTMFLLIPQQADHGRIQYNPLHSTMFLLIPSWIKGDPGG